VATTDGPKKRNLRTPAQRVEDLLLTYFSKGQISKLDVPDDDLLAGVRAAVEYAKADS
jgi:hypothetical protein